MDIRYVAGLFDGEGVVRIQKWAKPNSTHVRYQVRVAIGMSHCPVIESLKEKFGGSLHMNRHDKRNSKHRIQFSWIVSSQVAARFLRKVLPHLVVKREEALVALALQEHIDDYGYHRSIRDELEAAVGLDVSSVEERNALREILFQRITALKKRAYPPLTT